MGIQDIIVYAIIGCAIFFIFRRIYRQLKGKDQCCNCGSCNKKCDHAKKCSPTDKQEKACCGCMTEKNA